MIRQVLTLLAVLAATLAIPYAVLWPVWAMVRLMWQTVFQLDTRDVYFLPWNICPSSNVTISQSGGKYAQYKNRYDWLLELCNRRQSEAAVWLPN